MSQDLTPKTVKFAPKLIEPILSGSKISTWRLWDDKGLIEGDVLHLINRNTLEQFASARITRTVEKPLSKLDESDKAANERFDSDDQMYRTLEKYYRRSVGPETLVKIVWFELI